MRNFKMYTLAIAMITLVIVGFKPVEEEVELSFPEATGSAFISVVCDASLFERFEVQFAGIEEVSGIEAYQLDGFGYYYAVSAKNEEGMAFVEYFKTTEEEVNQGIYDYIELNERTTGISFSQTCREDFTNFPNWCETYNSGPVCGFKLYSSWTSCTLY